MELYQITLSIKVWKETCGNSLKIFSRGLCFVFSGSIFLQVINSNDYRGIRNYVFGLHSNHVTLLLVFRWSYKASRRAFPESSEDGTRNKVSPQGEHKTSKSKNTWRKIYGIANIAASNCSSGAVTNRATESVPRSSLVLFYCENKEKNCSARCGRQRVNGYNNFVTNLIATIARSFIALVTVLWNIWMHLHWMHISN